MPGKLLLTVAAVALLWWFLRRAWRSAMHRPSGPSAADEARQAASQAVRHKMDSVDLVQCPRCSAWLAPGTECRCGYRHPGF